MADRPTCVICELPFEDGDRHMWNNGWAHAACCPMCAATADTDRAIAATVPAGPSRTTPKRWALRGSGS